MKKKTYKSYKPDKSSKQVESNFLGSLLFLIFSLTVSLTVFLNYKPTNSFNVNIPTDSIAVKKAEALPAKKQHTSVEENVISQNVRNEEPKSVASNEANELVKQAIDFVNLNQPNEAKALLEQVLQKNPNDEEALTQLALIHLLDFKDEDKARPIFEKILNNNPENQTALAELVEIYSDSDHDDGINFLKSVYEKSPNSNVATGLGQVLMETHPKAAIPYLEKGGERALNDLAEAYTVSGNHEKAFETLQRNEELLTGKMQNNEVQDAGFTKDELVRVKMNMVNSLVAQGKQELAHQKAQELKNYFGDSPEYLSYLSSFDINNKKAPSKKEKEIEPEPES